MTRSILTLMLLASTTVIAQPTLTGAGVNPKMWTTQSYQRVSLPIMEVQKAGLNVTWDFNGMPNNGSAYTETNIPFEDSIPAFDTMTGTSIVTKRTNTFGTSYTYYVFNDTVLSLKGKKPGTTVYTETEDLFRFPFSFGDSFIDTSVSVYYAQGSSTPQNRRTQVIVTTDGYGTIILPNGATYSDVLRVRRYYTMDVDTGGAPIYHGTSNTYEWYKDGVSGPLMTASLGSGTNPTHLGYYLVNTTGIATPEATVQELSIAPNPASQLLTVSFNSMKDARLSIALTDVTGKAVVQLGEKNYYKGVSKETIDVSHLAKGVYVIMIAGSNSSISRKIEIL